MNVHLKKEMHMTVWNTYLKENQPRYLQELMAFLRIPSISSLPAHGADVKKAADWVAARLKTAGIEAVEVLPTDGHPVVYGQWLHAPGKPTIMIYGHFDTQPVDPLELWTHPPFEPVVKNERIYARGASDDKGNMLIPILAVEAMLKTLGRLPANIKFFFEGQEEIGSPQLAGLILERSELLACDMVLSADGGQWSEKQPAVNIGRRGLVGLQIDLQNAVRDVHSGTHGGTFQNPIHALAGLIASMHSASGRVAVDGFYDAVRDLSDADRAQIAEIPFDEAQYMKSLGVNHLFGETGYSTYERTWVRPTLEVNGIWGGFQGEGVKTVIPSLAHAKITCRLVPDQEPDSIYDLIAAYVATHAPAGVTASVKRLAGNSDPYLIPIDHPGNQAARIVLKHLYGCDPYVVRMGATIPASSLFLKLLGVHLVNFAFGLEDENQHAPDEFFRLESFERGLRAYGMILEELGG
jgi:acetylornithine deacetylase/succinyl-diaminopimelate desuccinylase-like protein